MISVIICNTAESKHSYALVINNEAKFQTKIYIYFTLKYSSVVNMLHKTLGKNYCGAKSLAIKRGANTRKINKYIFKKSYYAFYLGLCLFKV